MNDCHQSMIFVLILFGVSLIFATTAHADSTLPSHIEVIYDHQNTLTGIKNLQNQGIPISLYHLNAPDALLNALGKQLPRQIDQAKHKLLARFQKIGHERLKIQFMDAYQGVIKATQYGLNRYPAIVFDQGKAVVYGVTDLQKALAQYQHWKKQP